MGENITAKNKTADLVRLIKRSPSLRAHFSHERMRMYIKKVKALSYEKQGKLYSLLIEEGEEFKKFYKWYEKDRKRRICSLGETKKNILKKVLNRANQKDKALSQQCQQKLLDEIDTLK